MCITHRVFGYVIGRESRSSTREVEGKFIGLKSQGQIDVRG